MQGETLLALFVKKYLLVTVFALFGALAHAFNEIKEVGWKGWVSFLSDVIVCTFVGYAFYHLALLIWTDAAIFFTSIGSFWGTKGFIFIKDWFINSLKANIK